MDYMDLIASLQPTTTRSTKKRRRHSTTSDDSTDSINDVLPLPSTPGAFIGDPSAGSNPPLCEFGMKPTSNDFYRSKSTSHWKPWKPGDEHAKAVTLAQNELQQHALIVKRERDTESLVGIKLHSILVQSPLIKSLLGQVFTDYRGISTELSTVKFNYPFHEFVHRWDKFQGVTKDLTDEIQTQHIALLKAIIEPELLPTVQRTRDSISKGIISFDDLWVLYEPGTIVHVKKDNQDRAYLIDQTEFALINGEKVFSITGLYIGDDILQLGVGTTRLNVSAYPGSQPIKDIVALPLHMKPDVRQQLINRGKEWVAFVGSHHKAYSGVYLRPTPDGKYVKETVDNGRIMIDGAMFEAYSNCPMMPLVALSRLSNTTTRDSSKHTWDSGPPPMPPSKGYGRRHHSIYRGSYGMRLPLAPPVPGGNLMYITGTPEDDTDAGSGRRAVPILEDDHLLLCTNELRGYCLTKKAWVNFYVENVHDIRWNEDAFSSLVLPEQDKEILYAFADSQVNHGGTHFDDVIEGKGQGIIILLSGPPGVGKTLTAESIAEEMKRPLYAVSSAELGDISGHIEAALSDVLEICAKWDAVLLLDECDIFLTERDKHDTMRNRMVGVFLRQLEYYKGLLFLTTNRHADFDPAFASRIDLALDYPNLETSSRKTIWTTFLSRQAGKQADGVKEASNKTANYQNGSLEEAEGPEKTTLASGDTKVLLESSSTLQKGTNTAGSPATAGLTTLPAEQEPPNITTSEIEKLAMIDLNGREIKNVVKSAYLLAAREGKPLAVTHINKVLRVRVPKEKLAGHHMYY
ncbi:ATPase-like protein 4 [Elsinoe fawcettii]|nr:ATPase-like protein 4 [Elsinoe fawcettii]